MWSTARVHGVYLAVVYVVTTKHLVTQVTFIRLLSTVNCVLSV